MHVARVHQHHRTFADPVLPVAIVIGTAARGDRADGKRLVGMPRMAEAAPVLDTPRFDERHRIVTPEARRRIARGCWIGESVHRCLHCRLFRCRRRRCRVDNNTNKRRPPRGGAAKFASGPLSFADKPPIPQTNRCFTSESRHGPCHALAAY
ncbi:hypothetical protein D3C81_1429090 [compost metagenome]